MAEYVGRDRIVPGGAGLGEKRQARRRLDDLGQALRRGLEVDAVLPVERIDRGRLDEAVGQARRMGEEVAKGDVALGRYGLDPPVHGGRDPHVAETGQEARDRVVELEATLLVEHHDRDRGQRLRHRIDAHNRVGRHRLRPCDVGEAMLAGEGDLSPPHHRDLDARQLPVLDEAPHPDVDPIQAIRRQADAFRLSTHLGHDLLPRRCAFLSMRRRGLSIVTGA